MLLSCGDALIDFLPVTSADGRDAIVPVVGGSCLNIAVGAARLGAATGFVGGISTDLFGRLIADHAKASQVELRYATRSGHQTTLAFVRSIDGEPHYAFYDEGTASRNWTYRRGSIAFDEIDAIHVGSTTLIDEATAAETLAMVKDAADRPAFRSIRIAGPTSSSTRPGMSNGWMRLPPTQPSCGCRMSILSTFMAVAIMREGRGPFWRRAPALWW
jgi:sugar/nucleoside kinase (ribokinase family)